MKLWKSVMKEYQTFYEKNYSGNTFFLMSTKNGKRDIIVDFLAVELNNYIYILHVLESNKVTSNYLILDFRKMEKVEIIFPMRFSFFYHDINGRFQNNEKSVIDPYIQVHSRLKYNTLAEYKNAKSFLKKIKGIK